ncbi:hypothetical protein D3C78_1603570 [compost metagenome]
MPHSGVGGCAPRPKKLKPAVSRIAVPMPKVACTVIGVRQLGKMCCPTMRQWLAPAAEDASMNSWCLRPITAARTSRA